MRIPSLKSAAKCIDEGAGKAKEKVEQTGQSVTGAASSVRGLHNPGAQKPGRTTFEAIEWRGRRSELSTTDSFGKPFVDKQFLGAEARAFAQRGRGVGSAGVDVFVGGRGERLESDSATQSRHTKLMVGAEGHAAAFGGAVNGVRAGVTAGLAWSEKTTSQDGDLKRVQTSELLYGAVAEVQAQVGTVTGGKVDLFVGARGGQDQRWALTNPNGSEKAGGGVRGRGMVGLGVMADGEVGYDLEKRQARVSLGGGAALGVGLYGGGEITVGGDGSE